MAHAVYLFVISCLLTYAWHLRRTRLQPSCVIKREIFRSYLGEDLCHVRFEFLIGFRGAKESFVISDPDPPLRSQLLAIAEEWGPRLETKQEPE